MTHQDLQKSIMLTASKSRVCTLLVNRVAKGWVGTMVSFMGGVLKLANARPIESGFGVGSSDLIGVTRIVITPEMVGRTVAVFTACEVKVGKDKLRTEQREYLELVKGWGGIAVECRDTVDGLFSAIEEFKNRRI